MGGRVTQAVAVDNVVVVAVGASTKIFIASRPQPNRLQWRVTDCHPVELHTSSNLYFNSNFLQEEPRHRLGTGRWLADDLIVDVIAADTYVSRARLPFFILSQIRPCMFPYR